MTKKMLEKQVDTVYLDSETIKSFIDKLQTYVEIYGENAKVSLEQARWDDSYEIAVYTGVLETDQEYNTRIQYEKYQQQIKDERELREYERLQAKFSKS